MYMVIILFRIYCGVRRFSFFDCSCWVVGRVFRDFFCTFFEILGFVYSLWSGLCVMGFSVVFVGSCLDR